MKRWTASARRALRAASAASAAGAIGPIAGVLIAAILCSSAQAQVAVATPDAAVATAGAAAGPSNLWGFLFPTQEQCAALKDCICNTAIGEFAKSAAKPLTAATGGLLFSKCGVPTAEDLAKMAAAGTLDSEVGAAAKIKKSEAEAQARREAVRYLGTVDCNYWPEAKDALKAALRTDPNECVRFEAALALGRGCCCNKDIIDALRHSANGTKGDGAPAENSPRVRAAAADALAYCVGAFSEPVDEPEKRLKEVPAVPLTRNQPRGKGLLGVFFAASTPSASLPPVHTVAAPAPMPVPSGMPVATSAPPMRMPSAAVQPAVQPVHHVPSPVSAPSFPVTTQPAPAPQRPQRGLLRHLMPGGSAPPPQVMDNIRPTENVRASDLGPVNRGYVILEK